MYYRGILYVFPVFHSAWLAKKISFPAADDLFRDSLGGAESGGEQSPEAPGGTESHQASCK